METARLKAFLAAADCGSLTLAAEQLGYTPSGISQLVKALEEEMGFPLLRRSNRGVSLTREGRQLLPTVRALLRQEEHLQQLAADMQGLSTGHLTVASYSSIAAHWLPRVIHEFEQDFPRISIQILEGIRSQVVDWLDQYEADLAFVSDVEEEALTWWPLADVPIVVLVPPGHRLAEQTSCTLKECGSEPFIFSDSGRVGSGMKLLREAGVEPRVKFSTLEDYAAISMIANGLGICITNELILENLDMDLVRLPLEPPRHITMGLAVRDWQQTSPAARKFCQYARRLLTSEKYASRP